MAPMVKAIRNVLLKQKRAKGTSLGLVPRDGEYHLIHDILQMLYYTVKHVARIGLAGLALKYILSAGIWERVFAS